MPEEEESVVLKPREPLGEILLPESADDLAKFMDQPLQAIAESINGMIAAGPKGWMVGTGRIVQSILKARLYQQVGREIKKLRDEGKIPDDFAENKYGFKSWVDLLKAIDDDPPDSDLLDTLMAMFYGANKVNATDAQRMLSYRLFHIAKRLTSGELLLLRTLYDVYTHGNFKNESISLGMWAAKISELQGHKLIGLVLKDEHALVEEELITGYRDATVTPINQNVMEHNARLSDLGMAFCKNIETYHLETGAN